VTNKADTGVQKVRARARTERERSAVDVTNIVRRIPNTWFLLLLKINNCY